MRSPWGSLRVIREVGDLGEHGDRGTIKEEKEGNEDREGKYPLDSITSRPLVAWIRALSMVRQESGLQNEREVEK